MLRWIRTCLVAGVVLWGCLSLGTHAAAVTIKDVRPGEDVFAYVKRIKGRFHRTLYRQVIGAANPYREGDEAIRVAADDPITRVHARMLLAHTRIKDIHEHPLFEDELQELIEETTDKAQYHGVKDWTMGELKTFLLTRPEGDIKSIMWGLTSDAIGCVTKLMTNSELSLVGRTVFNPLPGSNVGGKGYLSARIQPNSPQDHLEDIQWQIFDAWSYATGDLVAGANPVDGTVENVATMTRAIQDVIVTFGLQDVIPWCALAHIDAQAEVERTYPEIKGGIWFQRLAGCDDANEALGISIKKMMRYAKMRTGIFGLYHETGQGDDFIHGAGNGFDMVIHEARKYGFSRALKKEMARVAPEKEVWSHANDAGGSLGPEVFNTPQQLVRCCLEDIFMGKLHGLTMGVDVSSRLNMLASPTDLDWCMDQIMPANPAYVKALPTRFDPALHYITTSYQDHVRLRHKFGYKVGDEMWGFFKRIEIVDYEDNYTEHFGDPVWVYYRYRMAKGDERPRAEIYAEGEAAIHRVQARGVPIARGHGKNLWDLEPALHEEIASFCRDVQASFWAEFTPEFVKALGKAVVIETMAEDRKDYFARPDTGRDLSKAAVATLDRLSKTWAEKGPDVLIVISDGLNAKAVMAETLLKPYLAALRKELKEAGYTVAEETIAVKNGRGEAGNAVGEALFKGRASSEFKVVVHIIGETPERGHQSFSVHIAGAEARKWAEKRGDYSVERIRGVSETGVEPTQAATQTVERVIEITEIKTHHHLLTSRETLVTG
ncbi:MAG: ethanolamine ammonia-lyase subunit EutB [Thermodesulfobacteriota bacterium]|nr:ethanolamine ammonia-lyase subunit EutB [Thermodesulfobacteriota bacterium]